MHQQTSNINNPINQNDSSSRTATAQMSSLLDLPAEIRTMIYGLATALPDKISVR
jgi:hypothetical protein